MHFLMSIRSMYINNKERDFSLSLLFFNNMCKICKLNYNATLFPSLPLASRKKSS